MAKLEYCEWQVTNENGHVLKCWSQTTSVTGFCQEHREYAPKDNLKRARKVSTEGKAARGATPDPGSIPGASTYDPELAVALETIADLREEMDEVKAQLAALQVTVSALQISQQPSWMPSSVPNPWTEPQPWRVTSNPVPWT